MFGTQNKLSVGTSWMACCPAHDDARPSLALRESEEGYILHCHAGCSQQQIIAELRTRGLWQPESERNRRPINARLASLAPGTQAVSATCPLPRTQCLPAFLGNACLRLFRSDHSKGSAIDMNTCTVYVRAKDSHFIVGKVTAANSVFDAARNGLAWFEDASHGNPSIERRYDSGSQTSR
jgi:hypothetical protein